MGARKSMAMILGACFGRVGPPCAPVPRPRSRWCAVQRGHGKRAAQGQCSVGFADSTKNRPVFDPRSY